MTELQHKIYDEAIRIGNSLCELAKEENGNYYWDTLQSDLDQNTFWDFNEALYSGSSGVALYLLELYNVSENKKYLDFAISHATYLKHYCSNNEAHSWAFLTGRVGISYFFLRLYEITNDQSYLDSAADVIKGCEAMIKSDYLIDDYINGASGTLTYLLKLNHYLKDSNLTQIIADFAEHLVNRASLGEEGLYWDKSEKQKFGLCGFSHGVSGVAFSFLELSKATNNDTFRWLAEYALKYEDYHYDAERLNWPDFRHGIYKPEDYAEQKKKFLEKNTEYFTSGGDMNAWCHGAMGIGLTRKRAYELTHNKNYLEELKTCVTKTTKTTVGLPGDYKQSYTVCHGGGGNADVFIQAYRITSEKKYLDLAEKVAEEALKSYDKINIYKSGLSYATEEDISLFMGTAGVGYFYLRTLYPDKIPSILALEYNHETVFEKKPFLNISKNELIKNLLKKDFPFSAESIDIAEINTIPDFPNRSDLYEVTKKYASENEYFPLEEEKYQLEKNAISASHINIDELVNQEKGKLFIEENEAAIDTESLQLTSRVKLLDSNEKTLMLNLTPQGVLEQELSPFSYVVLSSFQKRAKMVDILPPIYEMFETDSDEEKEQIKTAVSDQVKSAIQGGILILN